MSCFSDYYIKSRPQRPIEIHSSLPHDKQQRLWIVCVTDVINSSAPPQADPCLSFNYMSSHFLTVSLSSPNTRSPTFYTRRDTVQKPLKLVLMPSLVCHPPFANYRSACPLCLIHAADEGDCGNLLPPAYTWWIREQPSVPDAFSQILPTCTIRETIPSSIPKGGRQTWADSLCFPYIQFH